MKADILISEPMGKLIYFDWFWNLCVVQCRFDNAASFVKNCSNSPD